MLRNAMYILRVDTAYIKRYEVFSGVDTGFT